MDKKFVPLHVHSEYSALDGASKVEDLVKKAKNSGMPAMAITDHGVMSSLVSFYKKARGAGVKPLVGSELYITPYGKSRYDKTKLGEGEKTAHHLLLLAKNKIGAKNLNILCSASHLEGYYYKPRADYDLLREHSEGLICLTACLGGAIPQAILKNNTQQAADLAHIYKDIFKEDFYLEIQDHGDTNQAMVNKHMIKMSEDLGIPLVATNDSHFTNREDKDIHDLILSIAMGRTISTPKELVYTPEHYFKTPEEMWSIELFKHHPEALINTVRIAEKCNYIMELGVNHLPDFPVPEGHTQASYLRELTYKGLEDRYDVVTEAIRNRADYELSTLEQMGFPGYLLIVWDFIDWAKRQDIPVGPGRGSAAGSLICYAIGITDIDPLRYNLLFERFLNPERVSMPDIDVDFCIERRQEVMNYVAKKYGDDRVCQIITFSTLGAKAAFKDVARVYELPYSDSNNLSKLIPPTPGTTLEEALMVEDFRVAINNNPKAKEIVDMALRVEGMIRGNGTHAAGVIISKYPLNEVCPLMQVKEKKSTSESEEGFVKLSSQTQIEQKDAEDLGLLKMDFLGLRNLTVMDKAIKMIKRNHGVDINWHSPELRNMNNSKSFELISSGKTMGIFQLEGDGITKLAKKMQPSIFEDLSSILALYRPGPLQSGMDDIFVKAKHGEIQPDYMHNDLEPILKNTYGTMIYQEQIMQIAQVMGGYSLGEADLLRRAMGKKKPEEMAKQKDRFISGAIQRGYSKELSNNIFEKMAKFAEYGFNYAHSAAYGVITFRTAYLKSNFSPEFMAALMSSLSDTDKILKAVREANALGIKVLPPDVNKSQKEFDAVGTEIRFGLLSIKGIGEELVNSIIHNRESGGIYTSLADFCKRVNHKTYTSRSLDALIQAGVFDSIDRNRAKLLKEAEQLLPDAAKQQRSSKAGQISLFGNELEEYTAPQVGEVKAFDRLQELELERELMGIYISGHPLKEIEIEYDYFHSHNTEDAKEYIGRSVVMMGIIRNLKILYTKKQEKMAVFNLEDLNGIIPAVTFTKTYADYEHLIQENSMVQVYGTITSRDDEVQLKIDRLSTVEGLRYLEVLIPQDADEFKILELQKIMSRHKGDIPVVFNFENTDLKVVADSPNWIRYESKLVEYIESTIGKGRATLK